MKKRKKAVLGVWRITGMEVWDVDYFDLGDDSGFSPFSLVGPGLRVIGLLLHLLGRPSP